MMEIPAINPNHGHHSALLQPVGCLGRLEDVANWFAKRQGKLQPENLKPAIVLFGADHGVVTGLSHSQEGPDTAERLIHASSDQSIIRKLAEEAGASLSIVNLGVRGEVSGVALELVRESGSADIRNESAMSEEQYWEAVGIGEELAARAISEGANLLTASSLVSGDRISVAALICELAGVAPEEALEASSHESYAEELMAVEVALDRAQGTPSHDILRELGGLELAAMAGFYRAAARKGVPVLLDGKASAAAALAAAAWDIRIAGWMLASFVSEDRAHILALEELGLDPMMHLQRSLSGAKGAALLMPLLQSSLVLHRGFATVEEY